MSSRPRKFKRIPALDGIRAFAVAIVFASHCEVPFSTGGGVGVDMFFVLSGYLITSILNRELDATGTISLTAFYLRRLRRLMPALALLLVGALGVAWLTHDAALARDAVLSGTYLMDYARAFWVGNSILTHTWSLAVEEHFYLVFPLLVLALYRLRRHHRVVVLIVLFAAATFWRSASAGLWGYDVTYYRFDARLSGLLFGAILAHLLTTPPGRDGVDYQKIETQVMGIAALGIATSGFMALAGLSGGWFALTVGVSVAEALTAFAITVILRPEAPDGSQHVVSWLLSRAWVTYIGRISYGFYLFHYPFTASLHGVLPWWGIVLAILPTTILLSDLSYRFIERPILDGRKRTA